MKLLLLIFIALPFASLSIDVSHLSILNLDEKLVHEERLLENQCSINVEISCTVDSDGSDCRDIVHDSENCNKEVTYEFKWCNLESTNVIPKSGVSKLKINGFDISFDESELRPGDCITHVENAIVNTCKRSFYASLKFEGKDSNNNYCYGYKFLQSEPIIPGICDVLTDITCRVQEDSTDCNDIVTSTYDCGSLDVTYEFKYCNEERFDTIDLDSAKTKASINGEDIDDLDLTDIPPLHCRVYTKSATVNTCNYSFGAQLKVEGKIKDSVDYQHCFSYRFLHSVPKKLIENNPPSPSPMSFSKDETSYECEVSSEIECTVVKDGSDCSDIVKNHNRGCDEAVVYLFKWCNLSLSGTALLSELRAKVNGVLVPILEDTSLPAGDCREYKDEEVVNTCNSDFWASLKVEGKSSNNSYCFKYKFLKTVPRTLSPTISPTLSPSKTPTKRPTRLPSVSPTDVPTGSPTGSPISSPTHFPTKLPSVSPTDVPTSSPTGSPTSSPTRFPTKLPSVSPTDVPTSSPTGSPTSPPTRFPTKLPSVSPTNVPTRFPTASPTKNPSSVPTTSPVSSPKFTSSPTNGKGSSTKRHTPKSKGAQRR